MDNRFQTRGSAGTCYITPLLGAYLADSYWGRFKTILVFSIIYLVVRLCLLQLYLVSSPYVDSHHSLASDIIQGRLQQDSFYKALLWYSAT